MRLPLDHVFYRRLAVTAAALAACRLAAQLPLPGLAPPAVMEFARFGAGAMSRLSLLALGIFPLLTVLILAELVKSVAPALRRWEQADARNAAQLWRVLVGVAIPLAIVQGGGVARALESVAGLVAEPGLSFRVSCTLTLVAGTALAIALAGLIDRRGLGYGVWLVFLAPALAALPEATIAFGHAYAAGVYPGTTVLLAIAFTVLGIAGIVRLVLAARAAPAIAGACVWPLLIAYTLLAWVLLGLGLVVSGGDLDVATHHVAPASPVRHLMLTGLVMALVWLYLRSWRAAGKSLPLPPAPVVIVLATIALAGEMLTTLLGVILPLGSLDLVIAATVGCALVVEWCGAARLGAPQPQGSREMPL